jgi:hypothetical protein
LGYGSITCRYISFYSIRYRNTTIGTPGYRSAAQWFHGELESSATHFHPLSERIRMIDRRTSQPATTFIAMNVANAVWTLANPPATCFTENCRIDLYPLDFSSGSDIGCD